MTISTKRASHPIAAAFTLVELLVSTTLIAAIMFLLLSIVDSTQRVWQRTTEKAGQFQAARNAFEAMTRQLSQATLNTYWRTYDNDSTNTNIQASFQFRRHAELQFMSGPASRIFTSPVIGNLSPKPELSYPTHAVFFQAPLGFTEYEKTKGVQDFRSLDSLLASCGFFIEYGDDPYKPDFLRQAGIPPRYRFRLMELSAPSEMLTIFQRRPLKPKAASANTDFAESKGDIEPQILDKNKKDYVGLVDAGRNPSDSWTRPFWMKDALERRSAGEGTAARFRYARPLADNVVALVILPKKAEKDRVTPDRLDELAPFYQYDSWRILRVDNKLGVKNAARDNVLPPIVQITMVAMDETSAIRMNLTSDNPPEWTSNLFTRVKTQSDFLADVKKLEDRLSAVKTKVNYRIFTADVVMRGSKWSTDFKTDL